MDEILRLSMLQPLSLIFLTLCLGSIVYYAYAIYAGLSFIASMGTPVDSIFCPPISVIKPLCGVDQNAYQNLASFCQQDYPLYQIIFGIKDPQDPCLDIVRQLIHDFPDVDIKVVISDASIGANLKVNNLDNAAAKAQYDFFVLADSDVLVTPTYLRRIIGHMSDLSVGAVTCLYRPNAQGWIANLETLGIATDYLPGVIVANQLADLCFTLGPTIAIRRSAFEAIGGFPAIANYLADDFQIGWFLSRANYKIVLSDYVIDHLIETQSWQDLIQRQVRWNLCTKVSQPWGYLGLIFTHGTANSLGLLMTMSGSVVAWLIFAVVWSLRLIMAAVVGVGVLGDRTIKRTLWQVPFRDLISFALWCYSPFVTQLKWRGQIYRLRQGGKLSPLEPKGKSLTFAKTPSD
jgi:ceramide glucosyltransferase